jgi:hypothetical protein
MADGHLFLIEELENDIHDEAMTQARTPVPVPEKVEIPAGCPQSLAVWRDSYR